MKTLLFCLLLFSQLIFAQYTESHRSAVKQLLRIMNVEKTIIQATDIIFDNFSRNTPNFSQNEDLIRKYFSKYFTYDALEDEYVDIYCAEFTEEEIINLSEFYSTDLGKKLIIKLPVLLTKSSELGEKTVKEFLPALIKEIEQRNNDVDNAEENGKG
jgi:uncharacterized protein